MKRRLIMAMAIAGGAVLLLVAAVLALSDGVSAPTHLVQSGPFVRTVTAEGNLKSAESTPLSPPPDVPGALKIAWLEKDGAPVSEGDVVVRFDPTEFEDALIAGGVQRQNVENRMFGTGTSAQATRENLQLDSAQAQLEWESAQSFQLTDEDIFSRRELIESMIDGDLALEKKEYAEDMIDVRQRLSRADRELLEIEKRKATLELDKAQKGLSALEIRAPHDGVVVFQRDWRGEPPTVGSTVWGGRAIAEIPNLDKMEAEVFVLEADAGGIAAGQKARVTLDSAPGRTFEGTVKRVDALARPRIRGVPVQYFGVVIEMDRTEPELMKPGARVSATITLEESEDAIAIPRQALIELDGRTVVYRASGGKFEPVEVELGSTSLGRAVVTSGLEPGDRIALTDPTASTEGDQ